MNALSLLAVGLVLRAVPDLRPGWFPPTGWDGTNAQAIWLIAMGTITALFGAFYLVKTILLPLIWRWGAVRQAAVKAEAPTESFARPEAAEREQEAAVGSAAVPVSNQRMVA